MSDDKKIQKSELSRKEEEILKFWQENKIFHKSLEKPSLKGEFVFYEGPPTANGKPGIHHLEARAFKDAILRYKTMRGYYVRRKAGWDTHGLPVEIEAEKELGLKSKKEIEEYGIAEFNKKCREGVWKYLDLWEKFTDRIGFWLDQNNPYITYDKNYIESLWNIIKKVDEKGLLYKDYKVVPWCPRCGTGLSSHELAQGYRDVKDLSIIVRFELTNERSTYFLAWTTTPWTLPGNVGLVVGKDIDYVKIYHKEENYILAKSRLSIIVGEYSIVEEMKGKNLVGLSYEPLFSFIKDNISGHEKDKLENAYKVYSADFVTTTDGTGIVHTAVMYGQDDFELGTKVGLPKYHIVNEDGTFKKEAGFLAGKFVRDEEVAVDIIKDLANKGLLYKKEKYEHSYPHCWRCKTPLIYFARDSWYIKMSELRDKLVFENENINWEPNHIKEGRFGEWLREVKDWAISRERYWGTPLPVWVNDTGDKIIVDSFDTLKKYTKKSGNKYFVMRHGETDNNIPNLVSCDPTSPDHLNEKGKKQVYESAQELKNKKIDLIFTSDFIRTLDTTEIIREVLDIKEDQIKKDIRLREIHVPSFSSFSWRDYHEKYPKIVENFEAKRNGDESYQDVKNRVLQFIYEIENKYFNKNILIITHGISAWFLFAGAFGYDKKETLNMVKPENDFRYFSNAEIKELFFMSIPHNENYELDPHKPFIDEIILEKDGEEYKRVKEVMDVWLDSGAMPFAQDHFPFSTKNISYPADFICEAIDQTRGWFYTLLAEAVLLNKSAPYKNVICLGHILDEKGKKMSKSVGNVIDPWFMIEKYGADTLRLWMYSVNQPGESKNFDEKTILELQRQFFGLLYNVLAFYELYRDKNIENSNNIESQNILDQWIIVQFGEIVKTCTEKMDNYKLLEPVRAIKEFIGDLSTWYLRRSRDRIKVGDIEAKIILYFILKNLAKLIAPFAPFLAEDIWQKLRTKNDFESVHLCDWPLVGKMPDLKDAPRSGIEETKILENMKKVREIVSLALEARQKANIKVRQPLGQLKVKSEKLSSEYMELIAGEVNVKEVVFDDSITNKVELNINITKELQEEGNVRELVRAIQDMRKTAGLTPGDMINLSFETSDEGKNLVEKFESDIKKSVGANKISFKTNDGTETKVGDITFKIKIKIEK